MAKRRTTLLVVDADRAHRESERRILRSAGYRILDATNYRNAINVHQQHEEQIDLLLTAISLPDGNGYELAQELIKIQPGLPVLFVSGQAGAKLRRFYSSPWGTRHHLVRPFEPEALLNRIEQILATPAPFSAGASG